MRPRVSFHLLKSHSKLLSQPALEPSSADFQLAALSILLTPPHNSFNGFIWPCGYSPNSLIWSKDLYHLATASINIIWPQPQLKPLILCSMLKSHWPSSNFINLLASFLLQSTLNRLIPLPWKWYSFLGPAHFLSSQLTRNLFPWENQC